MIGASERLVLFSGFLYILLHANRLSVVIVWAFFLAMQLTTVRLDICIYQICISTKLQAGCSYIQAIEAYVSLNNPKSILSLALRLLS